MTASVDKYRVTPIDQAAVAEVRRTMTSPGYGHPAYADVADGPALCRSCLRTIEPGEKRILFTYDSFSGVEDYPQPGPVYIHADDCVPYEEQSSFPAWWSHKWLAFHAFGKGRQEITDGRSLDGDPDWVLERLFDDPRVEYVQVHSLTAGSFLYQVRRNRDLPSSLTLRLEDSRASPTAPRGAHLRRRRPGPRGRTRRRAGPRVRSPGSARIAPASTAAWTPSTSVRPAWR